MTDEEKIKELLEKQKREILDTVLRAETLTMRPRTSFLDSCSKITEIVLCWAWIALSVWITAYLMNELVPGFSEWLRML